MFNIFMAVLSFVNMKMQIATYVAMRYNIENELKDNLKWQQQVLD